jgi:hypothetical protein
MSNYKMSELLALPVRRESGGVMPFLKDFNSEVMFVGDGYHVDACVIAINSHDALTARVAELENALNKMRSIVTDVQDGFDIVGSDAEILNLINETLEDNS